MLKLQGSLCGFIVGMSNSVNNFNSLDQIENLVFCNW